MHIVNTSIIPIATRSLEESEKYLLLTRPYYQSPFLEPLLITIPLAIHISSGILLRVHRRNAAIQRYGSVSIPLAKHENQNHARKFRFWPPMTFTSISGYFLTPLVLGHAFVNRLLPWLVEGSSSGVGLGFVSHGFAKHPVVAWIGYAALVSLAAGHMTWGWARWLNLTPASSDSKSNRRRWGLLNASSALLAVTWMAGGLGVVARAGKTSGWIGKGYDMLYDQIPLLNM